MAEELGGNALSTAPLQQDTSQQQQQTTVQAPPAQQVTTVQQPAIPTPGVMAPPSSLTVGHQQQQQQPSAGVTGAAATASQAPPQLPVGQQQQQPAQQPAMESIQDVIRRFGRPDLVQQFPDDQALLQHLLLQAQQAQTLAPLARYGERVAGNWPAVEQFLAQQQQTQQRQAQDPWWKPLWNPPEYNPAWEQQIGRDAQGNLIPLQGAPPDIVNKYLNYQQFRKATVDKMMANPFEFFEPAITQLARREAQQIAQQQLQQHNDRQFATNFIQQNADWLCQKDQSGQPMWNKDATGQMVPVLSDWGQKFAGYVRDAAGMGIGDPAKQQQYALGLTQRDWALANPQAILAQQQPVQQPVQQQQQVQQQLTPAQQAQQNANNAYLNRAQGAQRQGNYGPQGQNGNSPVNTVGLSLQERLSNAMKANGVTDRDIAIGR